MRSWEHSARRYLSPGSILGKALSGTTYIISPMCDYMYHEHKQRGKIKDLVPAEEAELEKVEEQPIAVKT